MSAFYPFADAGLGRAKKGLDFQREDYVLGTIGTESNIFIVPTVAASQANTAIQGYWVLPGRVKISKLAVYATAMTAVGGTLLFNIVVGPGAYTQGNVAGNDNSSVFGICTNPALPGQAMFAADVPITAASFNNVPTLTTGAGFGSTAGIIIPTNPDAVYGNGAVLTLRATTPAGNTISNLIISAYVEPQPLSAYDTNPNGPNTPAPGINF